jgi:hypothetical protein
MPATLTGLGNQAFRIHWRLSPQSASCTFTPPGADKPLDNYLTAFYFRQGVYVVMVSVQGFHSAHPVDTYVRRLAMIVDSRIRQA